MQRKLVFQVEFDQEMSPYKARQEPNIYLHKYMQFRDSIISNLEQFIPVDVVPKDPPKYYGQISSRKGINMYHDARHNKLVHFPRRDSFEVSVDNFVLFSRLQQGGWPDVNAIIEWALRVSTKLLDLEEDNEQEMMNKTIQIDKSKKSYKHSQKSYENSSNMANERLPPIRHSYDPSRRRSNYATLPAKSPRYASNGRNTPTRDQNTIDLQTTKYFNRRPNRSISGSRPQMQSPRNNIYFADSRPKYKGASFHWNIGSPRNIQIGNSTVQVNEENPHRDAYRNKNVELSPLSNQMRTERDRVISQKVKNNQEPKIQKIDVTISQSSLNCFRHLYEINGNKIRKISNNHNWPYLVCQNILPLRGQYYFSFSILKSQQNNIRIGLAPLSYFPRFDQKQSDAQFICFNCSDGMIKDSKQDELAIQTNWRLGGEAVPKSEASQMRVAIDMDNGYIDWYVEDKIVGSAKMPRVFRNGFRVVMGVLNVGDSVLLNQEDWKDRLNMNQFDKVSYAQEPTKTEQKKSTKTDYFQSEASKKDRVEVSDFGQFSEIPNSVDSSIQVNFVGRIHRQRVAKYKKDKVDGGFQTDKVMISRSQKQEVVQSEGEKEIQQKIIQQNKLNKSVNKAQKQQENIEENQEQTELIVETTPPPQEIQHSQQKQEERKEQAPFQEAKTSKQQESISNPQEIKWSANYNPKIGYHLQNEEDQNELQVQIQPRPPTNASHWHESQSSHHTLPYVKARSQENLDQSFAEQPSDAALDKLETTLQDRLPKQQQQTKSKIGEKYDVEGALKWNAFYDNNIYMLESVKN